jgi:hypothetical protein
MSFWPRQESDALPGVRIGIVAVTGVVITVVSILVAWRIMAGSGKYPEAQASAAPPPKGLGTVERSLFPNAERGLDLRARQSEALATVGWADRDAGVAQIPIDRAINLYLAQQSAKDAGVEATTPRPAPEPRRP